MQTRKIFEVKLFNCQLPYDTLLLKNFALYCQNINIIISVSHKSNRTLIKLMLLEIQVLFYVFSLRNI